MKRLITLTVTALVALNSFSQDKIRAALDELQRYPQEKIYLLRDKQQFVAGETIWFSAFVFSGYDLSRISTNLVVELYDGDKTLVTRKSLPVLNGQAAGEIALPAKLREGVYFMLTYTPWMLNFPGSIPAQPVLIYNPNSPQRLQRNEQPWTAQAFVEGGSLIDGVPAKIAVRLSSASPLPEHWSGYISDKNTGEKLVSFQNTDPNVGLVSFLPTVAAEYNMVIEDNQGRTQTLTLPKTIAAGVQLKIDNMLDSIVYRILFKDVPSSGYRLVGTMNDEIIYEAAIKSQLTFLKKSIATATLDNGIMRLSLFNANDELVAERLCFVKPTALKFKTPVFTKRSLDAAGKSFNQLDFLSDTIENPYSVLVMDAGLEDPLEDENLLSALWFTNDVRAKLQHPAQYFTNPDQRKAAALDAILITEQSRNFDWNNILNNKFPQINFMPGNYITYKGTVFRGKKLVPNEEVNFILSFPDSTTQFIQAKTDSTGSFVLQNLFFFDTAKVYYQLNSKKSFAKDITIQFEAFTQRPTSWSIPEIATSYALVPRQPADSLPSAVTRALQVMKNEEEVNSRFKIMQEVTVHSKRTKTPKEKLNEDLSSPVFHSFNETVFDFVNEDQHADGYSNILEWLQGRVAGLRLEYRNGAWIPIVRGSPVNIYVNEMQVDPQFISGYPVSEIAMVKVIKGFFVGAFGGGSGSGFGFGSGAGSGGAVCIYLKKSGMHTINASPSLPHNQLTGYEKWKNYPAVNYSDPLYSQIKTDTRDVLYWNPVSVSENETMKVPIRFYNSDFASRFRIVIIGITPDGEPVYYNSVVN